MDKFDYYALGMVYEGLGSGVCSGYQNSWYDVVMIAVCVMCEIVIFCMLNI